jgi:hypothetical protein
VGLFPSLVPEKGNSCSTLSGYITNFFVKAHLGAGEKSRRLTHGLLELRVLHHPSVARLCPLVLPWFVLLPGDKLPLIMIKCGVFFIVLNKQK